MRPDGLPLVCHAFLANVDTTTQLRKSGRSEMRYPYKDKLFYPLLWPAQAMAIDGNKIVLPMGRGRKSIVLDRPEWLTEKAACRIVWNRMGYELHVCRPAKAREPVAGDMCMPRSISAKSTNAPSRPAPVKA